MVSACQNHYPPNPPSRAPSDLEAASLSITVLCVLTIMLVERVHRPSSSLASLNDPSRLAHRRRQLHCCELTLPYCRCRALAGKQIDAFATCVAPAHRMAMASGDTKSVSNPSSS
jgi:hypothetical protein